MRNVAGPSKDAVAVVVGEGFDPDAVEEGGGADEVAVGVGEGCARIPKCILANPKQAASQRASAKQSTQISKPLGCVAGLGACTGPAGATGKHIVTAGDP